MTLFKPGAKIREEDSFKEIAKNSVEDLGRALKRIEELQKQVDQLTLTTMAVWELLKEKESLNDLELMRKINEIDLRDGKLDGKIPEKNLICPECERPVSSKTNICIYCEIKVYPTTPF